MSTRVQVSSMIHSTILTVSSVVNNSCLKFFFSRFWKVGTDGRTTCAKTMITTGRDWGSAKWIDTTQRNRTKTYHRIHCQSWKCIVAMVYQIMNLHHNRHYFDISSFVFAFILVISFPTTIVTPFELDFQVISTLSKHLKIVRAVIVCTNFSMANPKRRQVFGHFGRAVKISNDLDLATKKLDHQDGLFVCLEEDDFQGDRTKSHSDKIPLGH